MEGAYFRGVSARVPAMVLGEYLACRAKPVKCTQNPNTEACLMLLDFGSEWGVLGYPALQAAGRLAAGLNMLRV